MPDRDLAYGVPMSTEALEPEAVEATGPELRHSPDTLGNRETCSSQTSRGSGLPPGIL